MQTNGLLRFCTRQHIIFYFSAEHKEMNDEQFV